MHPLNEALQDSVDLSLQGIERDPKAQTFGDIVASILEHGKRHEWNPKGEKWADRQWASIILPLRSALIQQVQLSQDEEQSIRAEIENESWDADTDRIESLIERTIESRRKLKLAHVKWILLGRAPLVGFLDEAYIRDQLKQALKAAEKERTPKTQERSTAWVENFEIAV